MLVWLAIAIAVRTRTWHPTQICVWKRSPGQTLELRLGRPRWSGYCFSGRGTSFPSLTSAECRRVSAVCSSAATRRSSYPRRPKASCRKNPTGRSTPCNRSGWHDPRTNESRNFFDFPRVLDIIFLSCWEATQQLLYVANLLGMILIPRRATCELWWGWRGTNPLISVPWSCPRILQHRVFYPLNSWLYRRQ